MDSKVVAERLVLYMDNNTNLSPSLDTTLNNISNCSTLASSEYKKFCTQMREKYRHRQCARYIGASPYDLARKVHEYKKDLETLEKLSLN